MTPEAMARQEAKADAMEDGGVSSYNLELSPGDQQTAGHILPEGPLRDVAVDMMKDTTPLFRTGVLITLALSLHNLPEGLATFVG